MITLVPLVLPNVDCLSIASVRYNNAVHSSRKLTECIAVAHLGPPAPYEMYFVLWDGRHFRVPLSHKLCELVRLVRFDLMKDNGMDIFAASQNL
jgi:hypothetical protein